MSRLPSRRVTGAGAVTAVLVGFFCGQRLAEDLRQTPEPTAALEAEVLSRTIDEFEGRLAADPGNPVVGGALVSHHLAAFRLDNERGHLERAVEIAEVLAPAALDRGEAYARLAAARLGMHDFPGALEAARIATEADPGSMEVQAIAFDASLAAGRYEIVERALASLSADHPGTLATRARVARWLEAHGEPDDGAAVLRPACMRLAGRAVRRELRAWCETMVAGLAASAGRAQAAEVAYGRALDLQPGYLPAMEGLADLAYAAGDWERAERLYLEISGSSHPDIYLRLAEAAAGLGAEGRAGAYRAEFVRLLSKPDAERQHAHELARFMVEAPSLREAAVPVVERDLTRRRSREALETAAWVRYRRGELKAALALSNEARRWGSPGATSDYVRALIVAGLGDHRAAKVLYGRALADPLALDPHAYWHWRRGGRPVGPVASAFRGVG